MKQKKVYELLRGSIFLGILLLLRVSAASADTTVYSLDNVMLGNGSQMTGTFIWTYAAGDFENGAGYFTDLYIPGFGSNINDLTINFDIGNSVEFSLTANIHGGGVDVSLFIVEPLTPTQGADLDLSRSSWLVEGYIPSNFISGSIVTVFEPPVAGAVTSMRLRTVFCQNLNNGSRARDLVFNASPSWNCTDNGLMANPGDKVAVAMNGNKAYDRSPVSGAVEGLTLNFAMCVNNTVPAQVFVPLNGASNWDCGVDFVAAPRDELNITLIGIRQ